MLAGFGAAPARKALRLLDAFPTLGIDQAATDLAAVLPAPWLEAARPSGGIAQLYGFDLVTRNVRDFPSGRHAFVIVPYRP